MIFIYCSCGENDLLRIQDAFENLHKNHLDPSEQMGHRKLGARNHVRNSPSLKEKLFASKEEHEKTSRQNG